MWQILKGHISKNIESAFMQTKLEHYIAWILYQVIVFLVLDLIVEK